MEQKLFDMLVDTKEISWRSMIYDLIKSEGMNPWDVNIAILAKMYITRLNQLKETDLKVSAKVLLAAALLLKIKSNKLVGEDLLEFDRLFVASEDESFYDDLEEELEHSQRVRDNRKNESFPIYPRTPQPRKRKVSVFDLLDALEKAMEVKQRRVNRLQQVSITVPAKKMDIAKVIGGLFDRILGFFKKKETVTFDELLQTRSREEVTSTFVPLLYLSNEQKIEIDQEVPFGTITIKPPRKGVTA